MGASVDLRGVLALLEKKKGLLLLPGIEPRFFDSSALNLISYYKNYAIQAPSYICTAVLLFTIHKYENNFSLL
jgi:hypothetical protein